MWSRVGGDEKLRVHAAIEHVYNAPQALLWVRPQPALPYAENVIAQRPENLRHGAISSFIPGDLREPISFVCPRDVATARTPVPKAAVNENCDFGCGESEVRTAGQPVRTNIPTPDAQLCKARAHPSFSGTVVSAFNRLHIAAASWRCLKWVLHELLSRRFGLQSC